MSIGEANKLHKVVFSFGYGHRQGYFAVSRSVGSIKFPGGFVSEKVSFELPA
jgi:hypothetical protein